MNVQKKVLLLAVILACASAYAQQPTPAYTFQSEIRTGANIGGYIFTPATTIDTIVMSDAGGIAMTAHQPSGGTGSDQTVVITPKRLVAREGQVIDGKTIVRIATAVLAINSAGQVGFAALWGDSANGKKLHAGVFVDSRFAIGFEAFASGAPTSFELTDDGRVLLKNVPAPGGKRPWGRNPIDDTWVSSGH